MASGKIMNPYEFASDYVIDERIDWASWQGYYYSIASYLVSHTPKKAMASGMIVRDQYRYLLWSNPHSEYWDANVSIDLSSSDYDYLEFEMKITKNDTCSNVFIIERPSGDFQVAGANCASGLADNFFYGRLFTFVSAQKFTPSTGLIARLSAQMANANYFAIPQKIYGIKYR